MINLLKNPKTDRYFCLKNLILSSDFPWYYYPSTANDDNNCYLGHCFLRRPEDTNIKFPKETSQHTENLSLCLLEILNFNDIQISTFFRINANMVLPSIDVRNTAKHLDHQFPHHNLIVYLTNSGGKTIVGEEEYDPEEDDIIMFNGDIQHCIQTPLNSRRIVLVATFQKYNKI